ncbi:hypothetical protein E4U35_004789 [Claviceps purpurea]|nr:hypothetical protein E4U35_004789 [Claviceps purpurea]
MDAMSFYYQWLVHPDSRWALYVQKSSGRTTLGRLGLMPTHDRVLFEPKKTTAPGIYTAVADDATGHVVVHNPGTQVVAIQQNQQLGRFRSMDPDAMVYAVDVADQPSASDLALVTEDHAEKHLVLSDQMIQEENTTVHPETKVNYFDSGDAEERCHVELLLQDYSQVIVGKLSSVGAWCPHVPRTFPKAPPGTACPCR